MYLLCTHSNIFSCFACTWARNIVTLLLFIYYSIWVRENEKETRTHTQSSQNALMKNDLMRRYLILATHLPVPWIPHGHNKNIINIYINIHAIIDICFGSCKFALMLTLPAIICLSFPPFLVSVSFSYSLSICLSYN